MLVVDTFVVYSAEGKLVAKGERSGTVLWERAIEGTVQEAYALKEHLLLWRTQNATTYVGVYHRRSGEQLEEHHLGADVEFFYPLTEDHYAFQTVGDSNAVWAVYSRRQRRVIRSQEAFWGFHPPVVANTYASFVYPDGVIYQVDWKLGTLDTCCVNELPRYALFPYRVAKAGAFATGWVVGNAQSGRWQSGIWTMYWSNETGYGLAKAGSDTLWQLDRVSGSLDVAQVLPFVVQYWMGSKTHPTRWVGWDGNQQLVHLNGTTSSIRLLSLDHPPVPFSNAAPLFYLHDQLLYYYRQDGQLRAHRQSIAQ